MNGSLSQARADALRRRSTRPLLDLLEFTTRGVGSRSPLTTGASEADKGRNRRASLRVTLTEDAPGELAMIQKKICLLGGFGVGKTSLVSRFVHSIFSDKYLTTVGVKIDKKRVDLGSQQVDLVIWDIYGEDDFQKVRMSYLRGASGYLLVADGTRRSPSTPRSASTTARSGPSAPCRSCW